MMFAPQACFTNYHNDYSVKDDIWTYYEGLPSVVQVGDHQFVERTVLNLFIALMLNSW
jgi:hypothetical protein